MPMLEDCFRVNLTLVWQDLDDDGCFHYLGVLSVIGEIAKVSELILTD